MIKYYKKNSYIIYLILLFSLATFIGIAIFMRHFFIATYISLIAIPTLMSLLNLVLEDIVKQNTYELAKRNHEYYMLGIINQHEYQFRKNEIIEMENKKIDKTHKQNKDKNKYKININE